MSMPQWFAQLDWHGPLSVAVAEAHRRKIPYEQGCYVFTTDGGSLRPGQVLYVGATRNLRKRLGCYLRDFRVRKPIDHKGCKFIYAARDERTDHGVFVRWTLFGARPTELETNLCDLLMPECTDRWPDEELWNDTERLDERLLG
jgi:hypothetical protein